MNRQTKRDFGLTLLAGAASGLLMKPLQSGQQVRHFQ
jgi:hypothetical protein